MKNRLFGFLLAVLLGTFGINNFYVGKTKEGIIDVLASVLLCWTFVAPVVISVLNLVRGCMYLWCPTDEEFNEKFCVAKK